MEILYRGVETKPSKKMASKQKQAAAVIMNNEALNMNDIMKELIPEHLQTKNLLSTHIYIFIFL